MKMTPRDLLLERHRGQLQKLDAVRAAVLSKMDGSTDVSLSTHPAERNDSEPWFALAPTPFSWQRWLRAKALGFWNEVVWSSRRFWIGMAAIWSLLLILNLQRVTSGGGSPRVHTGQSHPFSWGALHAEQQRLMADLDNLDLVPDNSQRPAVLPRPRTQLKPSSFQGIHEASLQQQHA